MDTITAKGRNGSVTFDGERVTFAHRMGTRVVPVDKISHTVYRRAGALTNGSWGMAVEGQVLDQRAVLGVRAALDGNLILMQGKRQRAAFDALDAAVNAVLLAR